MPAFQMWNVPHSRVFWTLSCQLGVLFLEVVKHLEFGILVDGRSESLGMELQAW